MDQHKEKPLSIALFEPAGLQGPFLENSFGDRYLYSVNRAAFNRIGADTLYASHYGEKLFKENTLNIIIGTDSGLLVNYIHKKGLPDGARFLFVELPEIIERLSEVIDWDLFGPNICCVSYEEWVEKASALRLTDYIFINRVNIVKSIAAEDVHLDEYRELYWQVYQEANHHFWEVNVNLGNEAFTKMQIVNLAENRIPGSCLKNLFAGKTAVLLAGGPSLDDIFPWLEKNRDKVVVLAVSRISRRLLEVGITPDLIFAIDPHAISFDVSREMLKLSANTLLVHSYHVYPPLLGQWHGKSVYLGGRFPWDTPLNVETLPDPGPTVTNMAFAVAVEMGFRQIILGGVDLCFSKEGYTHAKGSNESLAGPQLNTAVAQVETNGGWSADTDHAFASAVNILGGQAKRALEKGCAVINPAAGAAKIANVIFQEIAEVPIESLAEPAAATFAKVLPSETAAVRRDYYQQVLSELSRAVWQFKHIKKLAKEGLRCNDGLFGRNGMRADFKFKKRMDKIESTLNTKFKGYIPAVKSLGLRNFLKITRVDPDQEWTDEEIERTGRIYYESYRDSAARFIELVNQARQRVESRLEEEKEAPDFEAIFRQWQKDGQPGRARIWRSRHQDTIRQLPDEAVAKMDEMEKDYRRRLEGKDTAHMQRSRKSADLANAMSKALALFKRQDLAGLRQLAAVLGQHESSEAKSLLHLAGGYIAEIEGRPADALDEYHELMSLPPGPLLENMLRRVSSVFLNMQDMNNASAALECLAAISPSYMPQYAELLRLAGEITPALNVYLDYLEKMPEDVVVMLKVGRFYQELNIDEGARLIFNHLLAKNPDNRAARTLLAEMEA